MQYNGYQKSLKKAVKGPYRAGQPASWRDAGKSLWDKTVTAGVDRWKWIRFLR